MIKLIIFDLDGVLVDTERLHTQALIDAVVSITGMTVNTFSEIVRSDGKTTKYKLGKLKEKFKLSDHQLTLIDDQKQQNVIRHFFRPLLTSPDQLDMLTELEKDYKLAIGSNSRRENVITLLNVMGITRFFPVIYTGNDIEKAKPDPEVFLSIIKQTDVLPEETLILEDSVAGQEAARRSGATLLSIGSVTDTTLRNIKDAIIKANNNSTDGGFRNSI